MYQRTIRDFQNILIERERLQGENKSWQQRWDSLIKERYVILHQLETQTDHLTELEEKFKNAGPVLSPQIRKQMAIISNELAGLKEKFLASDSHGVQLHADLEQLSKRAVSLVEEEEEIRNTILNLCRIYSNARPPDAE